MWNFYKSPDGGGIEVDIQEFHTNAGPPNGSGVAAGNCGNSNNDKPFWSNWDGADTMARIPPGYNNLVYYEYSAMLISDDKTNKYVCMWIDDILQNSTGCKTAKKSDGTIDNTHFLNRTWVIFGTSSICGCATDPVDFDVAYIHVWTCPSYGGPNVTTVTPSVQCNGTTHYGRDSNGLAYWQ
jgi:hypothetical protein